MFKNGLASMVIIGILLAEP